MGSMRLSSLLLVLLLLSSCGAREPVMEPVIVVHVGVPVSVSPQPEGPGFDPRSLRLRAASREVERICGHSVTLHVDAALLSNEPATFELTLVDAVGDLARALSAWKEELPESFALLGPRLTSVWVRYNPLAKEPRVFVDDARLSISVAARPSTLIPREPLLRALRIAYEDAERRRFGGAQADSIPAKERAAYFAYLTRTHPGRGLVIEWTARSSLERESQEISGMNAHAEVVLFVLRLVELSGGDPELRTLMERWLAEQTQRLRSPREDPKRLALLPRDAPFFRAERAYGKWVERRFSSLPERESALLAELLFERGPLCGPEEPGCRAKLPLPDVDRFPLGMGLVDGWRSAGYELARSPGPELVKSVVCPGERDARGQVHGGCNPSFAAVAIASPGTRGRLLRVLLDSRDPRFVAEVIATLEYARSEDLVALLRGLEPQPALYLEAFRTAVEGPGDRHRAALDDEGKRAWSTGRPELRAASLVALAESRGKLHPHHADGFFARFEKEWGARIDARTLGAFLDGSPRAFASVPRFWLALEPSARVDPLLTRLDGFLRVKPESLEESQEKTLTSLVARLCESNAKADIDRIHTILEGQIRRRPELGPRLSKVLEDTRPGRCPKPRHDQGAGLPPSPG